MIFLNKATRDLIEKEGEEVYPEECCGALLGKIEGDNRNIVEWLSLTNTREDNRERRFTITPQQYRQAEKKARSGNLELLGFYHSHPDHPARPSSYDLSHAWPWFVYLILSVYDRKPQALTGWILSEDRETFIEQPVEIQ